MFKIGIVGQGFVGSAIREGLKSFYSLKTYDLDHSKSTVESLKDLVDLSDLIFVCLPTPMRKSGMCDTRIVAETILKIDELSSDKEKIVIIKSTVPPGTTEKLQKKCSNISLNFSPEFLTEANSFEDFKNQTRIIIGGPGAKKIKQMFRKPFPNIPIVVTRSKTAEMVKYFTNCFLASKVIFANQMYDICDKSDIDYDKVCEYALLDQRIGKSHLAVPGPDGDLGYGGHCFPKDISALIHYANNFDIDTDFLSQVRKSNQAYRKNLDWLEMTGRAVSKD